MYGMAKYGGLPIIYICFSDVKGKMENYCDDDLLLNQSSIQKGPTDCTLGSNHSSSPTIKEWRGRQKIIKNREHCDNLFFKKFSIEEANQKTHV